MKCIKPISDNYFRVIASNDADTAQEYYNHNHNVYDMRKTDLSRDTYQGFTALHYAAYKNNILAFKKLYKNEYQYLTKYKVNLKPQNMQQFKTIFMAPQSNVIQLAVVGNSINVLEFILSEIEFYESLLKQTNKYGMSVLSFAVLSNHQLAKTIIMNELVFKTVFDVVINSDFSPVHLAAIYGNFENLRLLINQANRYDMQEKLMWQIFAKNKMDGIYIHYVLENKINNKNANAILKDNLKQCQQIINCCTKALINHYLSNTHLFSEQTKQLMKSFQEAIAKKMV